MLGEDVENQLRAVDHTRLECVLELALLHRGELVVDEQRLGTRAHKRLLELGELSLADVRARVGTWPVLDQLGHGLDACGHRELPQFRELAIALDPLGQHGNDESALGLGARRGVRLA